MTHPGMFLSHPGRVDQPVVPLGGGQGLDRVGDQVAGLERIAHPVGAHRDAVAHADRVEPHPDAPRLGHALLHVRRPAGSGACCRGCPRTRRWRFPPAAFCRSSGVNPVAEQHRLRRPLHGGLGDLGRIAIRDRGWGLAGRGGHGTLSNGTSMLANRACGIAGSRRDSEGVRADFRTIVSPTTPQLSP